MMTCAIDLGRPADAAALLATAAEADDSAAFHAIAGRLALILGNADAAFDAAKRAFDAAARDNDVEGECAALGLRGRAFDFSNRREEAARAYEDQAEKAAAAGLTAERLRALLNLGSLEVLGGLPPRRIDDAIAFAREHGAFAEQAIAEFDLVAALSTQGDPVAGARVAAASVERCRELRLSYLPLMLAAHGVCGSVLGNVDPEPLWAEAESMAPDSVELRTHIMAFRADRALRLGRYDDAVEYAEASVALIHTTPGSVPADTQCWLVLALSAAGRHDDASRALADARAMPDLDRWHGTRVVLRAAEAIVARDAAGVDDALASNTGAMPLDLALIRVLAAEILGGSDRARWLRDALDLYVAAGAEACTPRVRQLLREAGAPVPRRRRQSAGVPEPLVAHGVTTRECEVLRLLASGNTNASIAEQLFISVRTVETHVSSLLTKLGADNRGHLIALSVGYFADA
jgi:DNA-binding NarL/FixJ family response regulator